MANSNSLRRDAEPSSPRGLAHAESPPSGMVAEITRLQGEIRRLESVLSARENAIALVIHELRQPLSVIVIAAAYVEKGALGPVKAWAHRVRAAVSRLDGLVADLNDASFLESGRFTLELKSTDVACLVAASVARFGAEASISVEGDIPCVELDPRRVEQILTNLLSNAQKYGSSATAPRVSIARRHDAVVVTVLNEGPSLANDERLKVFEPYYRGRERKAEARGLGLGLYICKKLIEEHGGRIWSDGDARCTRFSFSLPIPEDVSRSSQTRIVVQGSSATSRRERS